MRLLVAVVLLLGASAVELVETTPSSVELVETTDPSTVELVETTDPSSVELVETTEVSRRSLRQAQDKRALAPRPAVTRPDLVAALAVLRAWDARRARAWATEDAESLRGLYLRGSAAGRADLRLLAAYRARGVVVRRLVTQVFDVRVLRRDARSLRLRVVDRVAGGVVVRNGTEAPLASSRPARRVVDLRRTGSAWRVAEVSGSEPGPRAGPPPRRGRSG